VKFKIKKGKKMQKKLLAGLAVAHNKMTREVNLGNKRSHFRLDVRGMEADISDDIGFCSAQVKDISRFGVCLSEIPRKLRLKGDKFLIIISDQEHRFKMHVQGRWEQEDGFDTIMGVGIINAPWSWTHFLSTMKPAEDDVWCAARW